MYMHTISPAISMRGLQFTDQIPVLSCAMHTFKWPIWKVVLCLLTSPLSTMPWAFTSVRLMGTEVDIQVSSFKQSGSLMNNTDLMYTSCIVLALRRSLCGMSEAGGRFGSCRSVAGRGQSEVAGPWIAPSRIFSLVKSRNQKVKYLSMIDHFTKQKPGNVQLLK